MDAKAILNLRRADILSCTFCCAPGLLCINFATRVAMDDAEKVKPPRKDHDETGCSYSRACAPSSAIHRYTVLFFLCIYGVGKLPFLSCSFVEVIHVLLCNILHKSGLAARKAMGGPKGGTHIREKQWVNPECSSEYYFINIIIFLHLAS